MYSNLGRKITNDEFDLRLSDSNFIRIDNYINTNTSISFRCKHCSKNFKLKPKNINKLNCSCIDKHNNYIQELRSKSIELIERYVNIRHKIKHKCLKCSLEFITSPKSILNSKIGCPSCSGKIFSTDKYRSLLPSNIELLSDTYIGSNKPHRHKCLDCRNDFITKPNYIIHMGTGCPVCSFSKGQKIIAEYLESKSIGYISEYPVCIDNHNLKFDFYLDNLDIFIEYDGIQHFQPVEYFGGIIYYEKLIHYDSLKNTWCSDNFKRLIRISYKDNILESLNFI